MPATFKALLAEAAGKGYSVSLKELPLESLPAGEVLVEIVCSSLNYKDALALTGRGKIIRKFPMVCGIDFCGRVLESASPEFQAGDEVLAVGQGLGEILWGGFSQRARITSDGLLHLPDGLTLKQSMTIGTAGFTAMLSVLALEHNGLAPGGGDVLVTGAAGGVGSLAVILLSTLGYKVVAATGRPTLHSYLRDLGAAAVIERSELLQKTPPLASERWSGAIDTVGGQVLASVLAATCAYGGVAACGLAGGAELATTVFPFILRNVALLGINSTNTPKTIRVHAWERLAKQLPSAKLEAIASVVPMSEIMQVAGQLLAGETRGRVVVDVDA